MSVLAERITSSTTRARPRLRSYKCVGAGDGNRTHVTSLEGWRTTIVLRPLALVGSPYGLAGKASD